MKLGISLPLTDIHGEPDTVREFAQAAEGIGYQLHGPRPCTRRQRGEPPDWGNRNTSAGLFPRPVCALRLPRACTRKIEFSTQVLILAQRQTALVAKQAACLDVLCGGRFRLGVGVGWNPVEFVGLNENFRNRGRRSEEQVEVMQALWAQPHVTFKGKCHTIDDAGINPMPSRRSDSALVRRACGRDAAAHRQVGRRLDDARVPDGQGGRGGLRQAEVLCQRGRPRSGRRSASKCGCRPPTAGRRSGATSSNIGKASA